jgi:hypothetical protein
MMMSPMVNANHETTAASLAKVSDCLADLQRLGIPLYDADGKVLWPPG